MSEEEKKYDDKGRLVISKAERETRKALRDIEAKKAMSDDAIAKAAFSSNHQRLRAERQAREAAQLPPAEGKAKPKRKAK